MKTKTLAFLAGIVWLVAGLNVCRIGIVTWSSIGSLSVAMVTACLITLMGFATMFVRMAHKNIRRIQGIDPHRRKVWHMMSVRSYIIMAVMITLGIVLRHSAAVTDSFIAFFYTGLGAALSMAGIVYVSSLVWLKEP